MPDYLGLIRREEKSVQDLSPDEAQRVLESYIAWTDRMAQEGRLRDSHPLTRSGRLLRRSGDELTTTDGPHTESAEIVGGYVTITADDYDQAVKIFGTHPHLRFGPIEVRKIAGESCSEE
ncbi:YciI family protein [Amycolatopsis magusensis]|uniref:YCII-related domain-containing protein n=1 Tax=Amycolatopsis magusensis TaxID=882444 RepID=A0ABS4PKB6_9PSEU|nr:YciI family protein [Amycolatopsis magusensis]MBP2179862.1 hypothetical protein [Amycolatopsis magusensis]MDI5981440.1 YciI family protein [Amycolatopsis magusensis]